MTKSRDLANIRYTKGTTASRPTGNQADLYYDTSQDNLYQKNAATWVTAGSVAYYPLEYLVIAGGGGAGGYNSAAGGGAGGYRCSVSGEMSGGGSPAESTLNYTFGTSFTITIGAGGTGTLGDSSGSPVTSGNNSILSTITSTGGGKGGLNQPGSMSAANGGSGGGSRGTNAAGTATGGSGISGQGYKGGDSGGSGDIYYNNKYPGSGGGGAGAAGANLSTDTTATAGGVGVASSITGTSVYRGGGGGGSAQQGGTSASGGNGGGGNAGNGATGSYPGSAGAANTGGGGGAGNTATGGNGGSGVVIIRYPNTFADLSTIDSGLTYTKTTPSGYKVYSFTAGTGTVTI